MGLDEPERRGEGKRHHPPPRGRAVRSEAVTAVPNRGFITLSIMLANIMQGVDNTILNVALPHIQGSLSASLDQIAWVLTSYIVCAAIMMPLTGWLAGRFGIKYVFLGSIIGFTIAWALCGAAASLGELVLFRALQGSRAPGSCRSARPCCCRSTRRSGTAMRWRYSEAAPSSARSWGRRLGVG